MCSCDVLEVVRSSAIEASWRMNKQQKRDTTRRTWTVRGLFLFVAWCLEGPWFIMVSTVVRDCSVNGAADGMVPS
eukprot:symbB.v1.2.028253.t1/scaffold2980.1/size66004/2